MKRAKNIYSLLTVAVCLLALNTTVFSQILHPTNGTMTLEACDDFQDGTIYYDSGGPNGPYSNNESGTLELCADCGQTVTVDFTFVEVETQFAGTCFDVIVILGSQNGQDGVYGGDDSDYSTNGMNPSSNCFDLTDENGQTTSSGGNSTSESGSDVASSMFTSEDGGCLSFTFQSDNGGTSPGWEALVGVSTCEQVIPIGGPVACNNQVQVSLDQFCQAEITPDMILEGSYPCYENFDVLIEGVQGNVITQTGNYVVTVVDVISGNSCWGNITIEDKLPPTIVCQPLTLNCVQSIPDASSLVGTSGVSGLIFPCTQNCSGFIDDVNGETFSSSFDVNAPGLIITDVNVNVEMTHTFLGGIEIYLTGPDGTSVQLWNDDCGSDQDMDVTFDDDSANTYPSCPPFSDPNQTIVGNRQPFEDLSALNGGSIGGTWTLTVVNVSTAGDGGTLDGWALQFSGIPAVLIDDNCNPNDLSVDYSDATVIDGQTCEDTKIIRTWTVTDPGGNSATCEQMITITPITLDNINLPPETVILPCGTDTSPEGVASYFDNHPDNLDFLGRPFGWNPYTCTENMLDPAFTPNNDGFAYGYPYAVGSCGEYIPLNPSLCNIGATYSDQEIPDCGINIKVIRLWQLLDWCAPENGAIPYTQIIKSIDEEDPHIDISVLDHDITVSTDPWGCEKIVELPVPEHLYDDCDDYVTYSVEIAGITNDPFNLPFSETHVPGSHYFPSDMIDGDAASGYIIVGAPKGEHLVTYIAEDACGNVAVDQITLYVNDETPPVPIAKQNIVVSLTSGSTDDAGIAKLYVQSVDNGSHDGCSDELYFEIRREDENSCWNNTFSDRASFFPYSSSDPDGGQFVKFCCDDIDPDLGYGLVNVVMRVWDDGDCDGILGEIDEDNYNETWATIRVEDKIPPTIQCPPDVTIDCDEDYLDMTLTGSAVAYTTCDTADPSFSDLVLLDACGAGTVIRTWSVVSGGQAASCTQTIFIITVDPFEANDIQWPAPSLTFECVPNSMGEPDWNNVACSLVASTVDTQEFLFEDGACRKIINDWTVIDWCQYDPNASPEPTGIWTFRQIVKIEDNIKPEINECEPGLLWATTDCYAQDVVFSNSATDSGDCASNWLKWEICLDVNYDWSCDHIWTSDSGTAYEFGDDNIYYIPASGIGDDVDVPVAKSVVGSNPGQPDELDLPLGDHRIVWTVHDGCGNVATCDQIWTVEDKKAPTPYCIQNLSTAVMDHGGTVTIWASDFDLASEDNCTAKEDLLFSFSGDEYVPSRTFTCADLITDGVTEIFELEMWVWDEYGNRDYCYVQLRVDDNVNACEDGQGTAMIAGQIIARTGDEVSDVEVELLSTAPEYPTSQMTGDNGHYAFGDNPMNYSYEVSSVKDDNYLNGVSTLDMVLIQKHILALELFDSAYKVIAADINSDSKVSAIDLLDLRKLVLGVYAELPNNDSWRFVDSAQEFEDISNPWPFTEVLDISTLHNNMMEQDFVGVKIGDVSGDAVANLTSGSAEIRTSASLDLMVADKSFATGDVVRVDISSEDFNDIYGYQFTMNYRGLEFVNVEAAALNVTVDNFGLHRTNEGLISTSWASSEAVSTSEVLFSIIFTATTNGQLSESISVGSVITPAEAYRGQSLSVENVSIAFRTDNGSVSGTEYVLYQNEPNPFASATVIGFELPTASEATISVYDVTGKVIKVVKGDYAKGYNELTIQRNELNSAGVMYYQLESGEYTATKKMILID